MSKLTGSPSTNLKVSENIQSHAPTPTSAKANPCTEYINKQQSLATTTLTS